MSPPLAVADTITFRDGESNAFVTNYTGTEDLRILNAGSTEDLNYGKNLVMLVGNESYDAGSNTVMRSLVRFDLASLQGHVQTITTAKLTLWMDVYGYDPDAEGTTLAVYRIADGNASWIEGNGHGTLATTGESTWNDRNAPSTPWIGAPGLRTTDGTDYDTTPLDTVVVPANVGSLERLEFDLDPSMVQTWISGVNAGVLVRNTSEDTHGTAEDPWLTQIQIVSADDPDYGTYFHPTLDIEYTPASIPEPITGSLLLIGGGILALRRRRK